MLGLGNSLASGFVGGVLPPPAYSVSFDGSGDYLSFTETTFDISDAGDDLTISFWAKRDLDGTEDVVLSTAATWFQKVYFNAAGTALVLKSDQNGQSVSITVTADTNWHHYSVSSLGRPSGNEATVTAFEDGGAVTVTQGNFGVSANKELTMNSMGSPSGGGITGFDGLLYQVAIFTEIVDAANVTAMYNGGDPINIVADQGNYTQSGDLAALWQFNEGTGTSTADSIGDLTCTFNGDAAWSSTTPSS